MNATTTPKLSENDVEQQICDFLRARHWRVTRNHVGRFKTADGRWITVGEVGHADWTATKPLRLPLGKWVAGSQLIYIEVKAPGKRPTAAQETWLACREQEGYKTGWWDSLESFEEWYGWEFSGQGGAGA